MAKEAARFQTTLWTQVLIAGREPDSAAGADAIARLCSLYWAPVYSFIRRRGVSPQDAQDLTQGFFCHILEGSFFSKANPEFGRFRNFLLGAVQNYMANERERAMALRRGGAVQRVSIHAETVEEWLAAEPTAHSDATRSFDRSWAHSVLAQALQALEAEQTAAGRAAAFARLKPFLQRNADAGEYDALAIELKMSKGAVAAAVHRLNKRFGELVRAAVAETVSDATMAETEMRHLLSALQES